jgi:hypothetical protein
MAKPSGESQPPSKFGMFYPRGYVVLASSSRQDAEQVRQSLVDGGYDETTFG